MAILGLSLSSSSDDRVNAPRAEEPTSTPCSRTLAAGTDLSSAISSAASGAVLCLHGGRYSGGRIPATATSKTAYVTLRPVAGESPIIAGELAFDDARYLRLQGLAFRNGIAFAPAASHVELIGNDITGPGGVFFFGDSREGGSTSSVLIQGNHIHDIDYTGPQYIYRGYGIKSIGAQDGFTVRDNTIESVAADYLQTDEASNWTVDGNTFLGPSLVGGHSQEHQDLWQVYAGGANVRFTNNIVRRTGTAGSLLFQMAYSSSRFSDVVVANNLFDHDSGGYTCQIYQSAGLVFRDNTIVGSHWGCLFREDGGFPHGSGYEVDHNVFAETEDGSDIGIEGGAGGWGVYDYNVSSDSSATGPHSVRDWAPSWANTVDYRPLGLPFETGYRPGAGW